jgi:hypothetical protein
MCLLLSMNWGFISQKTTFFIVSAVKTLNLTFNDPSREFHLYGFFEEELHSHLKGVRMKRNRKQAETTQLA